MVWEVWGHFRVSWEDELGGKGRGGSVVVTKKVKEELWKGNGGGEQSLMNGSGKFYLYTNTSHKSFKNPPNPPPPPPPSRRWIMNKAEVVLIVRP